MNIANIEQKNNEISQKNRTCCFWGCLACCLSPFVCFLLLVSMCAVSTYQTGGYRTIYPVGLDNHDAEKMKWVGSWRDDVKDWIKKEGKDQLFVGTWQIEIAYKHWPYKMSGWEQTRLEIRPDYTFILTKPCKDMDWLRNYHETVTGTWSVGFSTTDETLSIIFMHDKHLPISGSVYSGIRSQDLRTLREDDTSDNYLRLLPSVIDCEGGYFFETSPSWKKVIKE